MRGTELLGYVIEVCIPNNRKDDTYYEEYQTGHKYTVVFSFFRLTELTRAIILVELVLQSTSGNKPKEHVSENEAYTNKRALAADIHLSGIEEEQNSRYGESVRENLNVNRYAVGEEALDRKNANCDQRSNAKTNYILYQ